MLDSLGIIIGFMTVMLFLSLIVTALVQATQHLFKMRASNLLTGVTAIVREALEENEKTGDSQSAPEANARAAVPMSEAAGAIAAEDKQIANDTKSQAEEFAKALLGQSSPLQPASTMQRFASRFVGGERTWISSEQLQDTAKRLFKRLDIEISDAELGEFASRFAALDGDLRMRFLGRIRFITMLWAVVVAAFFQVSAIELLNDLSRNPELRAQAAAYADELLKSEKATEEVRAPDDGVTAAAKTEFMEKHDDLKDALKAFPGKGTRTTIVNDLRAALGERDDRDSLVEEYEQILDRLHRAGIEKQLERANELTQQLTAFRIAPWDKGWAFYFSDPHAGQNLLGVAITMLFLMFGAPFWFQSLRTVVGLRDALKPKTGEKTQTGTSA